jgi:hypothetical protein
LKKNPIKPDYSTTNGVILAKMKKDKKLFIICSTTNGINRRKKMDAEERTLNLL